MGKVLVVGSCVVDLTFYTDRIPNAGESLRGKFSQGLGGKGFNQAVAARLAGAETSFIGAVGNDSFGPLFPERLQRLGIRSAVQTVEGTATGAAAIAVDRSGQNSIVVALGANEKLKPEFLHQNESFFERVDVLLLQLETNLAVVEEALKFTRARNPNALTILNPAPAIKDLPSSILNLVDVLTPNETELVEIAGTQVKPDERDHRSVREACEKLSKVKGVLATLGEHGCYFYVSPSSSDLTTGPKGLLTPRSTHFSAFPVKAIDTTGAGDAFNGGLAAGLSLFGGEMEKAITYGSAVAAISVTRPGTSASMPTRQEVESFLNRDQLRSGTA